MPGADDFHTHLFQGVVGVFRLAARGHALRVNTVVVVAQTQRDGVGLAAQSRHLGGGQGAGRQRQTRAFSCDTGRAGLERDLHVRLFGDGAQDAGGGALEVLRARVVLVDRPAHALIRTSGW